MTHLDPQMFALGMEIEHQNALDEDRERAKTPKQRIIERIEQLKRDVDEHESCSYCPDGCGGGCSTDGCTCTFDWEGLIAAVEAL